MKLGLGTAQFGMNYGISNTSGQIAPDDVRRILQKASEHGISVLDTVAGYGNAEAVLGQCPAGGRSIFHRHEDPAAESRPS
ncbi:MAG: aldo/keto reductase [Verrucomicrobia bacterium]|nr:aldo/keto reductase [Verrucomicrobiota bacterium]